MMLVSTVNKNGEISPLQHRLRTPAYPNNIGEPSALPHVAMQAIG
jgi:hypothetical protein